MAEIRAEVRFAFLRFKFHGTNQAHGMDQGTRFILPRGGVSMLRA